MARHNSGGLEPLDWKIAVKTQQEQKTWLKIWNKHKFNLFNCSETSCTVVKIERRVRYVKVLNIFV